MTYLNMSKLTKLKLFFKTTCINRSKRKGRLLVYMCTDMVPREAKYRETESDNVLC